MINTISERAAGGMGLEQKPPFWVGMAGPSCSGKSALARAVAGAFPEGVVGVVAMDTYYRDLSHIPDAVRSRMNFDAPEALDWQLLAEHIEALRQGRSVDMPVYDFMHHVRRPERRPTAAAPILVLEGLHVLHKAWLRNALDLRVYVDAPDALCLARRMVRDARERGRSLASIKRQYGETVRPMSKRYVRPSREYADLVLDGGGDLDAQARKVSEAVRARCCGNHLGATPTDGVMA